MYAHSEQRLSICPDLGPTFNPQLVTGGFELDSPQAWYHIIIPHIHTRSGYRLVLIKIPIFPTELGSKPGRGRRNRHTHTPAYQWAHLPHWL